ncbi:hypothetical protein [Streptomyces sp. NPDC059092]|uniref:hypothetical protein n=1 Tax=Streptomyces sp. NPDC059092 TaxID=3346725 RepID=UPI0036830A6B
MSPARVRECRPPAGFSGQLSVVQALRLAWASDRHSLLIHESVPIAAEHDATGHHP